MPDIAQNTLYLTTPTSYVARDHLTLQVEVPVYSADLPPEERARDRATDWRKLSIPIHHLESICVFGPSTISPPALDLCREHGVAVRPPMHWPGRLKRWAVGLRTNYAGRGRLAREGEARIENCKFAIENFQFSIARHCCGLGQPAVRAE